SVAPALRWAGERCPNAKLAPVAPAQWWPGRKARIPIWPTQKGGATIWPPRLSIASRSLRQLVQKHRQRLFRQVTGLVDQSLDQLCLVGVARLPGRARRRREVIVHPVQQRDHLLVRQL